LIRDIREVTETSFSAVFAAFRAHVMGTGGSPTLRSSRAAAMPPPLQLPKAKQKNIRKKPQAREERPSRDDDEIQDRWHQEYMRPRATQHPAAPRVKKERQRESWDCGVACVQMVLGVLGGEDANPSRRLLFPRIAGSSTWSIDLAYLLSEYGVDAQYLTANPAIDEDAYKSNSFYAASLAEDALRVRRLLRAAPQERVEVRQMRLNAREMWEMMKSEETGPRPPSPSPAPPLSPMSRGLARMPRIESGVSLESMGATMDEAMDIVDSPRATPAAVPGFDVASATAAAPAGGGAEAEPENMVHDFVGHFVLILSADEERGCYVIVDPARDDERTYVPRADLDAARIADGTDEDLLLIDAFSPPPVPPPAGAKPKIARVCEEMAMREAAETRQDIDETAQRWKQWLDGVGASEPACTPHRISRS
jgi:hypothetical protein